VFDALCRPNALVGAIHTRRRFPCFARSPPFAVPEVVDGAESGIPAPVGRQQAARQGCQLARSCGLSVLEVHRAVPLNSSSGRLPSRSR
jgi:hypothetical protein